VILGLLQTVQRGSFPTPASNPVPGVVLIYNIVFFVPTIVTSRSPEGENIYKDELLAFSSPRATGVGGFVGTLFIVFKVLCESGTVG